MNLSCIYGVFHNTINSMCMIDKVDMNKFIKCVYIGALLLQYNIIYLFSYSTYRTECYGKILQVGYNCFNIIVTLYRVLVFIEQIGKSCCACNVNIYKVVIVVPVTCVRCQFHGYV